MFYGDSTAMHASTAADNRNNDAPLRVVLVAAEIKVDAMLVKELLQPKPPLHARVVAGGRQGDSVALPAVPRVALRRGRARAIEGLVAVDDDPGWRLLLIRLVIG
jgi:hypothetical protein